jgi:sigma-E factor negative regulatory protein RseC
MGSGKAIEHRGIVEFFEGGKMKVGIEVGSACSGCHASGFCGESNSKDRVIEIEGIEGDFSIGESVLVQMRMGLGLRATVIAYLVPFGVLLLTLVLMLYFTENEIVSGLVSLVLTAGYFFALIIFKNRLKQDFRFEVKRLF